MGIFSMLAVLGVLALFAVAHAMPQSGSDSSSGDSVDTREIKQESPEASGFMDDIRVTGRNSSESDEAHDDQTEAIKEANMCAKTAVDLEKFMSDIDTISNETRTLFFSQYCPQLERTALCMIDLVKANKPLLEENVFITVKTETDNYLDAVDLICKNNGEIIFKLVDPTSTKCVKKLWGDVMQRMTMFAFALERWEISPLIEILCRTFTELRDYFEAAYNVCQAPDLMSVYDLLYDILLSVTTCRNYSFVNMFTVTEVGRMTAADATPQSGSDSSSEESVEARESMEELPETRKFMDDIHETSRNSSEPDEVHDDQTEAIKEANMCAKTADNWDRFLSDIDTLSNETRTAFFSQYCPQLERIALCMIYDMKAARPNFEEDVFIILKAMVDNYPDAVDLACKNNGEIIFQLANPTTKKCVGKLWDDVVERMEQWSTESEPWDILHLTQIQCETSSELRQYIERELNVCKAPDLISVYDLFYNTLFSVTTCRNYVPTVTEYENHSINNN